MNARLSSPKISLLRRPVVTSVLLALPGVIWLAAFSALPLAFLAIMSFWKSDIYGLSREFTFDNYKTIFSTFVYTIVLLETIKVAAFSTLLTLLVAYPIAYFLASIKGHAKNICLLTLFMPFWTSYVVRTFIWLPMLGIHGFVNAILLKLGVVREPLGWLLYNQGTVALGLVYVYLLFMVLPIYLSLDRLDPRLIEAAGDLGAGPFRTFYRVTLPLSLPGILSGAVMVFLLASGVYVTPQLLGGAHGAMFGSVIASQYTDTNNWALGAAMSVVLIVLVLACLSLVGRRVKFDQVFVGGHG